MAIFATFVIALGLAMPAFADVASDAKGSCVVNGLERGDSATAYQVIAVTWDGQQYVDPAFTWDADVATWLRSQQSYKGYVEETTDAVTDAYARADAAFFDALSAALKGSLSGKVDSASVDATQTASGYSATFGDLPMGGYVVLVKGTGYVYQPIANNLLPQKDGTGAWVLPDPAVDPDAAGAVKRNPLDITKKILDSSKNQVSVIGAGYGDAVAYRVEVEVPQYPASAISKKFGMYDNPTGLTINQESVRVYGLKGDQDPVPLARDTNYTQGTTNINGDSTALALAFTQFYDTVKDYDKIRVEYTATVNADAAIGSTGNPNEATLEFNNDPYVQDGYETDSDNTTVYSYGLDVTKVEKGGTTALTGAKFTVKVEGASDNLAFVKVGDAQDGRYRLATGNDTATDTVTEIEVGSAEGSKGALKIDGLSAGEYLLHETVAPAGYNLSSKDFPFTIADSDTDGNIEVNGSERNTGYVTGNVENTKGFELPVTGGAGTVAMTAAGVVLMGAAVVALRRLLKSDN